jgi:hypothetical protein
LKPRGGCSLEARKVQSLGNDIAYNSGEEIPYSTVQWKRRLIQYCTSENIQQLVAQIMRLPTQGEAASNNSGRS